MNLLITHLVATMASMFLGYYHFCFAKEKKFSVSVVLSFLLLVSAITGVFLNLHSFSPFHILSIVVIATISYGSYEYSKKKDPKLFNEQIWPNFLGLNLAFLGAFYPSRYLGYKFWSFLDINFGVSTATATKIFWVVLSMSIMFVIYLIVRSKIRKEEVNF